MTKDQAASPAIETVIERLRALKEWMEIVPQMSEQRWREWDGALDQAVAALASQQALQEAFRAGFEAGLNSVDKFGEQLETADEAWAEYAERTY